MVSWHGSERGVYLSTLCWTEGDVASFAYPLSTQRSQIHNANFLGAALLARVAKHSGEKSSSISP